MDSNYEALITLNWIGMRIIGGIHKEEIYRGTAPLTQYRFAKNFMVSS